MPRPTKLHKKLKPTSIQKPSGPVPPQSPETEEDPGEARRRFELELCWCIQQLEKQMTSDAAKKDEKRAQDIWKTLAILKSNNHPMIRKRQLMRTYFGDYRSKMAKEEKKLNKMAKDIKITSTPTAMAKCKFVRKSLFQTAGSDFKFNFDIKPEDIAVSCEKLTINDESNTPVPSKAKENSIDSREFKFTFTNAEFKFNFNKDV